MTRILGIDPGSRITGFGVVDMAGQRTVCVASGCIRVPDGELPARLKSIFEGVSEVIREHRPEEMAVEVVFMSRNAASALKLGQARGAALVAGVHAGLSVFEFTPTQIKQAIVGRGRADKTQVQYMIKMLLGLDHSPLADAADALAVAVCHGHTRETLQRMEGVRRRRGGRWA